MAGFDHAYLPKSTQVLIFCGLKIGIRVCFVDFGMV
jgi:hypothetical protein